MLRVRFFVLSFLVVLFSSSLNCFAMQIDKTKLVVDLEPGENYTDTITFKNTTQGDLAVRVYLEDFVYTAPFMSDKKFLPPYSTDFSIGDAISYSPVEFSLSPQQERRVNISIKANMEDKSLKAGVLFFEVAMGSGFDATGKQVALLNRIGTLLFVHSTHGRRTAEIVDVVGDYNKMQINLKNSGDKFVIAKGSYYVMDNDGLMQDRGVFKPRYFFPGDVAQIDFDSSSLLKGQEYMMVLTFDLGDSSVLVRELDFSVDESGKANISSIRE